MLIYNQTTLAFRNRCLNFARLIMAKEMGISFGRNRFKWKNYSIPLSFVIFEHPTFLGHFNSHIYQIGLNKKLMYTAKDKVLKDIIRHELAHLFCFLMHGRTVDDHGVEFREICRSFGWDESVYRAYMSVENENDKIEGDLKSEKVIERIKKLLNLASSENKHEAELATIKANQLLLKHNLEHINSQNEEEDVVVKRVLEGTRKTSKHQAIYEILTTFHVQPVFNHGRGHFYLEILGDRVNVEIADYIANYLDLELEHLWKMAQKENVGLKGLANKNSFFEGMAQGYKEKMREQKSHIDSKALVLLKKDLEKKSEVVYSSLRYTSSKGSSKGSEGRKIGKNMGRDLSFRQGIDKKQKSGTGLLSWLK